jgi:hypothetical protein
MFRLIHLILYGSLALGVGSALADLTMEMCRAAVHAHQHDQLSYSQFTKAMLSAQPRTLPKRQESNESNR